MRAREEDLEIRLFQLFGRHIERDRRELREQRGRGELRVGNGPFGRSRELDGNDRRVHVENLAVLEEHVRIDADRRHEATVVTLATRVLRDRARPRGFVTLQKPRRWADDTGPQLVAARTCELGVVDLQLDKRRAIGIGVADQRRKREPRRVVLGIGKNGVHGLFVRGHFESLSDDRLRRAFCPRVAERAHGR